MSDTRRAIAAIEASEADLELVETLLSSRSDGEAVIAYMSLQGALPPRALVMLANLRELLAELPDTPFVTGTGLDILGHVLGYEYTGRSYRRIFESDHGYFGIEFVGGGTMCDAVVVRTATSRFNLRGDDESRIDHAMLQVLVHHQVLLDALLDALQALGYPLEPVIYVDVDDFVREHAAAGAGTAFSQLF